MEFPHLGKHCSEQFCNKLDFLPMKCDACGEIFCSEHFSYRSHSCPSAHQKDVQVPICPLCGDPVPTPRDVLPDVSVGAHIDKFCKSEKTKIYTNRCTYKNCKKKELVPFQCTVCRGNFCLKHRHTVDHECKGSSSSSTGGSSSQRSLAAQAAFQRQQTQASQNKQSASAGSRAVPPTVEFTNHHLVTVQGGLSEDEALARALALSMQDEDEAMIHGGQPGGANTGQQTGRRSISVGGTRGNNNAASGGGGSSSKDKCNLS